MAAQTRVPLSTLSVHADRALYACSLLTQAIHPILYATVAGITVNLPKFFSELAIPRQLGFSVRCHAMPCQAVPVDSPYCMSCRTVPSFRAVCQHSTGACAVRCAALRSVGRPPRALSTLPLSLRMDGICSLSQQMLRRRTSLAGVAGNARPPRSHSGRLLNHRADAAAVARGNAMRAVRCGTSST